MYLPHLGKACILLGYGLEWATKAAARAARGLAQAGDGIREPKPAVSMSLFVKIVSRNALPDAFAQAVWVSWIFFLRVRPECLI